MTENDDEQNRGIGKRSAPLIQFLASVPVRDPEYTFINATEAQEINQLRQAVQQISAEGVIFLSTT